MNFPTHIETVLFDFDGTLFDSSKGIFECLRYAFEADGKEIPTDEELRRFIGPPLHDSFQMFYGFQEEEIRFLIEKYHEKYKEVGLWKSEVYPGIPELLSHIKSKGYKIASASSKPVEFIHKLLERHNLIKYFDHIDGIQAHSDEMTKADVIRTALTALGTKPQNAIMVGDRKFDIEGAREVGVETIAVLFGFGSEEEFKAHHAAYIAKDTLEVEKIILGE